MSLKQRGSNQANAIWVWVKIKPPVLVLFSLTRVPFWGYPIFDPQPFESMGQVAEGELGELAPARVHHLRVLLWRRFRGT